MPFNNFTNYSPFGSFVNQPQSPFVLGKVVRNENEIRPNEIASGGIVTIFPKHNYSYFKKKCYVLTLT